MKTDNFFAELKRRNVYKVAVAYAVVGWLIAQIATQIFPFLEIPNWVVRLVIMLIAIGFPIALVIAWAFEATSEGIKLTEDVDPIIAERAPRKHAWIYVVVVGAAISVALFFLGRYTAGNKTITLPNEQSQKSIAVLPLVNEGGEKDQQYFSDGLSEDLITALSQLSGLKVIGRNSSFQFRESKDDSKTIGAKLGVAHLLEGSVRRAADAVRISAELINAADGTTLWSQHYDRPYKDLFKLQDDITSAVADALKTKLFSGGEAAPQNDRPPSGSLAAYNAFLQGQFYAQRVGEADLRKAIVSLETAIKLDPKYARAYAALAQWQLFLTDFSKGAGTQQLFTTARSNAEKALSLEPNLAAAHASRGLVFLFADIDLAGMKREFERAAQLAPNDLDVRASLAQVHASLGHPEAAIEPIRQTLAVDPRNVQWYSLLSSDLMAVGRLDEAENVVHQQLAIQNVEIGQGRLSSIEALRGNAAAALEKAKQISPGQTRDFALANAQQVGHDQAAADAALKNLIDQYGSTQPYLISRVYGLRNDADKTFEWLNRAWAHRDNNVTILYYDPFLLRYKGDPRFAAFCKKMGVPTPEEVAGASKP